jgi:hypothetical protein
VLVVHPSPPLDPLRGIALPLGRAIGAVRSPAGHVLCVILGGAAYGAAVGAWQGAELASYVACKLPMLLFLTALINGLLHGVAARAAGYALSLPQSLRAVLAAFAWASVMLGALAPVLVLFDLTLPSPESPQAWRSHDLLGAYGTEGIQTPIRMVGGKLVGTKRLHDSTLQLGEPEGPTVHPKWLTSFNSHTGKALLLRSYWEDFQDFWEAVKPERDELWVTNGRVNELWQSGFDDVRRPYIMARWPYNFIEIHPEDAKARGIESGDFVSIENDKVLTQTGGYLGVEDREFTFTELRKAGHIKTTKGSFTSVAIVTDAVRKGVAWTNFLWPESPANSIVPRVPDPVTNRYRFKLGKGRIAKVGESPYKKSYTAMSFAPRHIQ